MVRVVERQLRPNQETDGQLGQDYRTPVGHVVIKLPNKTLIHTHHASQEGARSLPFIWLTQASEAVPCVKASQEAAEPKLSEMVGTGIMVSTHSVTAKLPNAVPEDAALPHCLKTLSPGLTVPNKNERQHQREWPPSSHPWLV